MKRHISSVRAGSLSVTGSKEAASVQHLPLLDSCMEHSTLISWLLLLCENPQSLSVP